MPNRFLKESICTSESIDNLSLFEEVFFYRLLVNCDDFGRTDARGKVLRSRLFPLRDVSLEEVESAKRRLIAEDLIFIYCVDGKEYIQIKSWGRHQQCRATTSKFPEPVGWTLVDGVYTRDIRNNENDIQIKADDSKRKQLISDDIKCNQTISDDNRFARISNNDNDKRISYNDNDYEIGEADAAAIVKEQDQIISAAENSGFPRNAATRAKLVDLYAEHGMKKMLEAIDACVNQGKSTIAYLQGVLRSEPKKSKPTKTVVAQNYTQRDYSKEDEEQFARMLSYGSGAG